MNVCATSFSVWQGLNNKCRSSWWFTYRQCIAYSLINCVSESQHNWHIRASLCEVELIYCTTFVGCMNVNTIVYRGWVVKLLEPLASWSDCTDELTCGGCNVTVLLRVMSSLKCCGGMVAMGVTLTCCCQNNQARVAVWRYQCVCEWPQLCVC